MCNHNYNECTSGVVRLLKVLLKTCVTAMQACCRGTLLAQHDFVNTCAPLEQLLRMSIPVRFRVLSILCYIRPLRTIRLRCPLVALSAPLHRSPSVTSLTLNPCDAELCEAPVPAVTRPALRYARARCSPQKCRQSNPGASSAHSSSTSAPPLSAPSSRRRQYRCAGCTQSR